MRKKDRDEEEFEKWADENPDAGAFVFVAAVILVPVLLVFAVAALPLLIPVVLIAIVCGISLSFLPFPPI